MRKTLGPLRTDLAVTSLLDSPLFVRNHGSVIFQFQGTLMQVFTTMLVPMNVVLEGSRVVKALNKLQAALHDDRG